MICAHVHCSSETEVTSDTDTYQSISDQLKDILVIPEAPIDLHVPTIVLDALLMILLLKN